MGEFRCLCLLEIKSDLYPASVRNCYNSWDVDLVFTRSTGDQCNSGGRRAPMKERLGERKGGRGNEEREGGGFES